MIFTPRVMRRIAILAGLVLTLLVGCAGTAKQGSPKITTGMDPEGVTRLPRDGGRRKTVSICKLSG